VPRGGVTSRAARSGVRRGTDYVASLRDGRDVWVLGHGHVDDVTTDATTAPVVATYAAWYDRHRDAGWRATLMRDAERSWAFTAPTTVAHLRAMGAAISQVSLLSGGLLTHNPGYGALIALGVADAAAAVSKGRAKLARAYRDDVARSQRFVTFSSGNGPSSDRGRPPDEALAVRVVKRTRSEIVVDGVLDVHTAVPYAHEILVAARHPAGPAGWAWFAVPIGTPGLRVIARQPAVDVGGDPSGPRRFDELDAIAVLDHVTIPDERVFALGAACDQRGRDHVVGWLLWHQLLGWLARAELTLGFALALADAFTLRDRPEIVDAVTELMAVVQTIRTCVVAAELDPERTAGGFARPRRVHLAPAALCALANRTRCDDLLRRCAGAAAMVAPTDTDLGDDRVAAALERVLGATGGAVRARAALLRGARDHVGSSLAAREAAYEMFGSGGPKAWHLRLRHSFEGYEQLIAAAATAGRAGRRRRTT
jgi:4-hydroxyphenylacetate 3-monooxygenase